MSLRARIALGDRAAWGEAFVAYRRLAERIFLERGRGNDVDDLVQETFVSLPAAARKCAPTTTLGGCVVTAALFAIRSFDSRAATNDPGQCAHGLSRRRAELEPGALAALPSQAWAPDEVLEVRERVHHLSLLVTQLRSTDQQVVLEREFGSAPVNRSQLCRARRRLQLLAREGPLAEALGAPTQLKPRRERRTSRAA